MLLNTSQLPVLAAIRFNREGPGFALPILRHPNDAKLQAIQEVDEQLDVVSSFRVLDGDATSAMPIRNGPFSIIGQPQIYVFVTEAKTAHVGTLAQLKPFLRAFVVRCSDYPAIALQIAELIGTTEEKRDARMRMRRVIAEKSGLAVAQAFYQGSVLRKVLWDRLITAAPDANATKRILLARSRLDGRVSKGGSITIDLSAIDPSNYRNSNVIDIQNEIAAEFAEIIPDTLSGVSRSPAEQVIVDSITADVAAAVTDRIGIGAGADSKREAILHSALITELALIEKRADIAALSSLIFRRNEFPDLLAVDPSGQILLAIINRIKKRVGYRPIDEAEKSNISVGDEHSEIDAPDTRNPVVMALEKAGELFHLQERRVIGRSKDFEKVQRQIEWIGSRLASDEIARAEEALASLIGQQSRHSRVEDIFKTVTAVADLARREGYFEWALMILEAIGILGKPDAVAITSRALTLSELGRHGEAIIAFETAIAIFPENEAALIGRAEALRDLGRHEEALAAFEEIIIRHFPISEVALNGRAGILRDLGRHEEALATFEEAIRRFPMSEVALNGRAEILRDLGRHEEALVAFEAHATMLSSCLDVKFEAFGWNTVIDEAWEEAIDWQKGMEGRAARHNIVLIRNSAAISLRSIGDRSLIRSILGNLFKNAIKYSLPRYSDFKPMEVRIFGQPQTGVDVIQVESWGIGIPEDKRELIFQKFYRAEITDRVRRVRGMGLGLYISRLYAKIHRGELFCRYSRPTLDNPIRVERLEGFETLFELRIPKDQPIGARKIRIPEELN
jgi:signal transduction histidine kinase